MQANSGSPLIKAFLITLVALGLLVPLGMLRSLIEERVQLRHEATQAVAQGWGGRQLLGGMLLAIPVTHTNDANKSVTHDWYVLPESTETDVELTVATERRKIGIYEVPVYVARIKTQAHFDVAREAARLTDGDSGARIHFERARLIVPVSDLRGLRNVEVSGTTGGLEPTASFPVAALAAPFPEVSAADAGTRDIRLTMELAGTESLKLLPLARSTQVRLSGNWPHPGFTSGFLPIERHMDAHGFKARWQVLDLNRPYGDRWFEGAVSLANLEQSAFGVDLVQPVDLYQQVTRSVKYGGLFIGLSLLTLFLVEFLIGRPMHPIQYGLMGLALCIFYLMLLALSEHIGFALAYLAAASALCIVLGIYIAGALRSGKAGTLSAGIFATVYGLLYLLVNSEDYALLAGALALFALLAALMLLTRKVDWYGADQRNRQSTGTPASS